MENFGKQLNRLVRVCLKTKHEYLKASEHARSDKLKNLFGEIAEGRQQIINELHDHMPADAVIDPEQSTDIIGAINTAWEGISNIMSGNDDKHLLKMCRNADHAALESYDEILQGEILYSDLKPVLVKQRTAISQDSQKVNDLYFESFPAVNDENK